MKIPLPTEETWTELSVVPLVNVVFLLLIFFMLVGQVSSPEALDVQPPTSTSGTDPADETIKILLTRDGQIAVERVVVPASRVTQRVAAILAERPAAAFQVKADARVEAVTMIRTMERLRAAGVEQLTLLTEQDRSR